MTKTTDTRLFAVDGQSPAPGAYLKSIRRERRISPAYLQQQIGLTNTLFEALEADDCDRLPNPVYVRGYLRRYAELVDERVAPVLAAYQALLEERGLVEVPVREEPPQRPYIAMMASALGLLLATSLVFGAILSDSGEYPEEPMTAVEETASEPAAAPAGKQAAPAAVAGDSLRLAFTTDSWVEVVDARDHILAVSLQREGTSLELEGKPPFTVSLGYGPGVSVSYLGERVAFEHDPETFASKFVVGK